MMFALNGKENIINIIKVRIIKARNVVVPAAGHYVVNEQPETIQHLIQEFVEKLYSQFKQAAHYAGSLLLRCSFFS